MSFKEEGYLIIRNLIDKNDALSLANHLKQRNDGDIKCEQVMGSPSFYSDNLLLNKQIELLPIIEKHSKLKLFKTYNYARVYKKGAILRIHTDRPACEVSITLDLGGDPWGIWILDKDENPLEVKLNPGDALLYKGCDVWHWRGKFNGDIHPQVFMHYVDQNGPFAWAKDDVQR